MIGIGIVGPQNHCGKTLIAEAFAIEAVARDEDIALGCRLDRCLFIANRERLRIGAVGEENAAVFRSKGMDAGRSDDEAQRREPGSRHIEVLRRQHQMIERMNAGCCCSGHLRRDVHHSATRFKT